MVVVATGTLWVLFSMWLVFPHVGMPRMLCGAAGALMGLQFLALLTWGLASENCEHRPCSVLSETTRAAAGLDLPALSAVVLVLAGAQIARDAHRQRPARRPPEPAADAVSDRRG